MEPHVFTPLDMGRILEAPQIKLVTNWTIKKGISFANGVKGHYWLYKRNHSFLYSNAANIFGRGQRNYQDHLHKFTQPLERSRHFSGFNSINRGSMELS